jgi:hypothetical protein
MPKLLQILGIHPLAAFALITIDFMLFGKEIALGPIGWAISAIAGLLLTIPTYFLQRHSYHDTPHIAFAKALTLGILTAIPTPLPSLITGTGSILGLLSSLSRRDSSKTDSTPTTQELPPKPKKEWYDAS